jgi:hypothetical protein
MTRRSIPFQAQLATRQISRSAEKRAHRGDRVADETNVEEWPFDSEAAATPPLPHSGHSTGTACHERAFGSRCERKVSRMVSPEGIDAVKPSAKRDGAPLISPGEP